jgi:hypothetical protein
VFLSLLRLMFLRAIEIEKLSIMISIHYVSFFRKVFDVYSAYSKVNPAQGGDIVFFVEEGDYTLRCVQWRGI